MLAFHDIQEMVYPITNQFEQIQRIILFGSRARGDREERSDIDLAIDADLDIIAWDRISSYFEQVTLLPIDLIWMQHASNKLRERINQEGVVVFERKNEGQYHSG